MPYANEKTKRTAEGSAADPGLSFEGDEWVEDRRWQTYKVKYINDENQNRTKKQNELI